MMSVAVTGATGAMGRTVLGNVRDRSDMEAALAITRQSPDEIRGDEPVSHPADMAAAMETGIDVLVDFTVPEASVEAVEAAKAADVAAVVGTTGFDDAQREQLERGSESIPILVAPNFSRGIHALVGALEETLARVPGYDIELTETHHNRKRDAPSGTAERLLDTIDESRSDSKRVHGRSGDAPRSREDIGVHARRAGSITGEHEVLFAGNDEEIRLVHRAESRGVFASGALDGAAWLDGKPSGWYRFSDVIDA